MFNPMMLLSMLGQENVGKIASVISGNAPVANIAANINGGDITKLVQSSCDNCPLKQLLKEMIKP